MTTVDKRHNVVVVKAGGDLLESEASRTGLAANVRDLVDDGYRVVVLHGGGPQVTRLQTALGIEARKVGGRRITSPEDLRIVKQALCGEVNVTFCSTLIAAGVDAFGCHGASSKLIKATRRPPKKVSGSGEVIDFGEVGDVIDINTKMVTHLLDGGCVPVIATLGVDDDGACFNINADTTSVVLAQRLNAHTLLMATGVGAIFRDLNDPTSRYGSLTRSEAKNLIETGIISGGMIPKVEEALSVLGNGVSQIVIVTTETLGAFRAVLRGDDAIGTRILQDGTQSSHKQ